jgi:hypothetical protein
MKKLRIAFIGNFRVNYTTENERKWSFEKLGHEVLPLQEDQTEPWMLMDIINQKSVDMIIYSHTHGWEIPGLISLFSKAHEAGIPTVSVHLDKWQGLSRAADMGKEATWFTDYLFMADFSPEAQELYKKMGLNNVYYLKPGVVERDCYIAAPDHVKFPHEIVFVGSKGYHSEYPFRKEMIDFLQQTYGDRFGHYGNDGIRVVREHELNVLYASAKIAVGDSCFAGQDNYVSDRYYETRGRGGVLIHPFVNGVDHEGVFDYDPQSLSDLKKCIDMLLVEDQAREDARLRGHQHVKKHETYTNRAEEMLEVIFG